MQSIDIPVLGNVSNTESNRSKIHGSCGRSRVIQGEELVKMKDFLNIKIPTDRDDVEARKLKSQSLSPTKLAQSKICSQNG